MFYLRNWSAAADNATSIGGEWTVVASSGSGWKTVGGMAAPIDDKTATARLSTPLTVANEGYTEVVVGAAQSVDEAYFGFSTGYSDTDLASVALYVRFTAGLIRLYRKNANSSSLNAIGTSGGNLAYVPTAGDRVRVTLHGGNLSFSINGVVKYTVANPDTVGQYLYPALRSRTGTTLRLAEFKSADYGVETDPGAGAPGGGAATNYLNDIAAKVWTGTALVAARLAGVWNGSSIVGMGHRFLKTYTPPVPLVAPSTTGPDPAMTNPPAMPAGLSAQVLRTVNVTNAAQLAAACADAQPGDLINLAAGTYTDQKLIILNKQGTAEHPIIVRGPKEAVIHLGTSDTDYGSGYGGQIDNSQYVYLWGFTITKAPKGLVCDQATNCWLKGLTVYDVEQEGIHLRNLSSNNVVEDCIVHDTGKKSAGFGEAFYCGSAKSNWSATTSRTGGAPDVCNDNVFRRNSAYNMTGEGVDIKEGTNRTLVEYCRFDGSKLNDDNSADTWIDVKGNDAVIQYNFGNVTFNGAYSIYDPSPGYGLRATFRGNTGNCWTVAGMPTGDPAINDKVKSSGAVIYDDNFFLYTPSLTNDAVTPAPVN